MTNISNISFKIGGLVFLSAMLFFIIALFWYQGYSSAKVFLSEFFVGKNLVLIIYFLLFSTVIGYISSFFIKNVFTDIEKYNRKLKDYNHFLAHELKTPISIVNSSLDVLKYGFDKEKVINSQEELKSMTKIIDGLLNFSETIQISNKKNINLENFIFGYISFLNEKNNITIINKEFNFSILTDEILFERVLKNLVENALKYSVDNKLNIFIQKNKLIFENKIFATIEDEELEKIFTKYYSKSYNENKGNGIGLGVVKEIVKVLGYEIKISSKDNKFVVEITYND
ncbi:MAG: HAMP domain-containing sensor histidine kinase [Candidatus Gracilibacteria bacterium]